MNDWFLKIIFKISGYEFNPLLAERAPYILKGLIFILIFTIIFIYLYRRYFWREPAARKLFFWSVGLLSFIVLAKYAINSVVKGYIPDRLLFYGLPSPRAQSLLWFILPIIIFAVFLFYRKKIENLPRWKFLAALYAFFCLFILSIAGIRGGLESIIDPLTRTKWEYSGNLPLIHSVKDFLANYVGLIPKLAIHSTTHPPGYSLILYFFYKVFSAGFLGQALLLVLLVGTIIVPLFNLWVKFFPEWKVRRFLEIFIFTPSVVIFTAISMDAFMMLIVWVFIAFCFIGWKNNWLPAALGGLAAGIALFSNFLFLLLAPAFLLMFLYVLKSTSHNIRWKVWLRALFSLGAFLLFFGGLYLWSHYSIIENFFAARAANEQAVKSNFESFGIYLIYFLINIADFAIYLGLPFIYLLVSGALGALGKSSRLFKIGLANLIFLLVIGVFQGEVERLWLFMAPFFIIGESRAVGEGDSLFPALVTLSFFQIMVTQVLFYTYW